MRLTSAVEKYLKLFSVARYIANGIDIVVFDYDSHVLADNSMLIINVLLWLFVIRYYYLLHDLSESCHFLQCSILCLFEKRHISKFGDVLLSWLWSNYLAENCTAKSLAIFNESSCFMFLLS